MSVYVEILVRAPMETLWEHTQQPALHQQWDLRFSRIEYLTQQGAGPQRFRYATRLAFGREITGEGETTGTRTLADGSATSALKFSSEAPLSIIREGAGYWQYVPTAEGIRFLTWYDYRTRFGTAGALFDRVIFRPMIGWATAWSFDRLKLWIENGIDPRSAVRNAIVHAVARLALAIVFAYQGAVPKLLLLHPDEIALLTATGVPTQFVAPALLALGVAELALAATLLVDWTRSWPAWLCLIAMPLATITVAVSSPASFGAAFNPLTLNLSGAALALIDLCVIDGVPSARRCRRRPIKEDQ